VIQTVWNTVQGLEISGLIPTHLGGVREPMGAGEDTMMKIHNCCLKVPIPSSVFSGAVGLSGRRFSFVQL